MTRLPPYKRLIVNMKERLRPGTVGYLTKEQAYEHLKQLTGQDFGYDISAWERWLKENKLH